MKRIFFIAIILSFFTHNELICQPVGWLRDGTSIYPNTSPPLKWGIVSKEMLGLRFRAEKPEGNAASGKAMPDGVVREWLVLGPVSVPKDEEDKLLKDELYPEDNTSISPDAGEKVKDFSWQKLTADSVFLDFMNQLKLRDFGTDQAVYAHTYVYSAEEGQFLMTINHANTIRFWLNGKLVHKPKETSLTYKPPVLKFEKGWNRLLLRSTPYSKMSWDKKIYRKWYISVLFSAINSSGYRSSNILWKKQMPALKGFGGPIVVGDKVFVLSQPTDLVCMDKLTGKILWIRSNNYDQCLTEEEKKNHPDIAEQIAKLSRKLELINASFLSDSPPKLEGAGGRMCFKDKTDTENAIYKSVKTVDSKKYRLPKGQDVGYAGFTPVCDGKNVYVWFANGVAACYDLDGKQKWMTLDNQGSFFEHGYSSSPVLTDGKLIVFMNKMIAFDAETGKVLWRTFFDERFAKRFHGTPFPVTIGSVKCCVLPTGYILRTSDGKILYAAMYNRSQQQIPSPVVKDNIVYDLTVYARSLFKIKLPDKVDGDAVKPESIKRIKINTNQFPAFYNRWHMSTPIIHNGLAYCLNNAGVLTVIDIEKEEILYQKLLDLDHYQTGHMGAGRGIGVTPVLAGGHIYIFGNTGTALVIKPGRKYEQVAKNRIESVFWWYWRKRNERFVASPFVDKDRLYVRGARYMYCIGEKK